jgi:hypothetical protein
MRYQAVTDSFVLVSPTDPQKHTGKKGHKKAQKAKNFSSKEGQFFLNPFVPFVATLSEASRRVRCGWRSGLIRRWSSYPFCRECGGGRC